LIALDLEQILGPITGIIDSLSKSGLSIKKGATIHYSESEIQLMLHIKTGAEYSRVSDIKKIIKRYFLKAFEIDNIVNVEGFGLTHNEDLEKLEVIQRHNNKVVIDFAKMLSVVKSDLIILSIRKKISPKLKKILIVTHITQNPRLKKGVLEAHLEVAIDYAELWRSSFDSFSVKNIEFNFNLTIAPITIEDLIPLRLKKRTKSAAISALKGNRKALGFLRRASETFLLFESEELMEQLKKTVYIEQPDKFEIVSIVPKMGSYQISDTGHFVVLPSFYRTTVRTRLESGDITLTATIGIDIELISKLF
jgi:hypothetical protein